MTRIVVVIVRKIWPTADDKTVLFLGAGAIAFATALWGPFMEVWEGLHAWKDYNFDFWHLFDSHAPAVGGAMLSFWCTMKAANLIPPLLEDVPMTVEQSTMKMTETNGQTSVEMSKETHSEPALDAPKP